MPHIPMRVRAVVATAAVALSVAACGSGAPEPAAPVTGPDLYASLPQKAEPPSAAPLPPPTVAPPSTPPKAPVAKPKAAAKPQAAASGPGAGWKQVGGDEFGGALSAWNLYDSKGGFGTGLRKPEAISVADGKLNITAREDVSGGMGHQFSQLYGRWEFRVRTDKGRGFGSAILLWPDSEKWPEDGEVDIMEVPGENRDLAHFVLHAGADNNLLGSSAKGDFSQWHTFAVEWLPDRITWFVDGKKKFETTDKAMIPTTPMHLTMQLDQGPKKDWIEARDETTPAELALQVDWVRIYAPA
jgi:glycosyl hydrolase family 16